MRITFTENKKMNHHEMQLIVHPKNRKLAQLLTKQFAETLGEIEVFDEYHNIYQISILSIYYAEIIDHKMFIYTEKDVYRMGCSMCRLKSILSKYGFYQINVRTLINEKHILNYSIGKGCRRRVTLDNGEVLVANRHYHKEFDSMIENKKELLIDLEYPSKK